MRRLCLIRHGEDERDPSGVRGLSARGRSQAEAVAQWALHARADADIVASSLTRAQQSAQVIAHAVRQDFRTDPRLDEIRGHGQIPRLRQGMQRDGESWSEFVARVRSFLEQLSGPTEVDVLAITHSGVFDAVFELITGAANVELQVDYGAISVWEHRPGNPEGEWLLEAHNMAPHVAAIEIA